MLGEIILNLASYARVFLKLWSK